MDGVAGRPGNGPASVSSFSGSFQAGMIFYLRQGGMWFQGYWWWVPNNGDTAPQKFALWNLKSTAGATGVLIPGTTVTSGTLTQGAWNFVPLAAPIPLSIGAAATQGGLFCATTAWTAVAGFPDTNHQFGTGDPFASGIVNGPLATFGQTSALPNYGAGSTFGTATNDPTVAAPVATDSTFDNFWIDIQVSDTAPALYAGTYQLYPHRFDANVDTSGDAATNFVIATEISLSQPAHINAIWYFSPSGTAQLATRASVYSIAGPDSGSELIAVTAPSWSGAAASGWVHTAVAGNPLLGPGKYKVAVYNGAATPDLWSAKDNVSLYWLTGEGTNGVVNGPLSAPPVAAASIAYKFSAGGAGNSPPFSDGLGTTERGQGTFAQTGPQYPYLYVDGGGQNYWLDVEVTPAPAAPAAGARPVLDRAGGWKKLFLLGW